MKLVWCHCHYQDWACMLFCESRSMFYQLELLRENVHNTTKRQLNQVRSTKTNSAKRQLNQIPTRPNDKSIKYQLDQMTSRPNDNSTKRQLDETPTWPKGFGPPVGCLVVGGRVDGLPLLPDPPNIVDSCKLALPSDQLTKWYTLALLHVFMIPFSGGAKRIRNRTWNNLQRARVLFAEYIDYYLVIQQKTDYTKHLLSSRIWSRKANCSGARLTSPL
jgi:hypothetical protein